MNSKLRALIWEHGKVAGTLCVWSLLLTGLLFLTNNINTIRLGPRDFQLLSWLALGGVLVLFLLRLNVHGHLEISFERRQARLPLPVWHLTLIPLILRSIAITIYFFGFSLMQRAQVGQGLPLFYLAVTVFLYITLQGWAWSRSMGLYLPFAAVAMPLFFFTLDLQRLQARADSDFTALQTLGLALLWLLLLAASLGTAYIGVLRERFREPLGLLPASFSLKALPIHRPRLKTSFRSSLAALAWYERRGKTFTAMAMFLLVIFLLIPIWIALKVTFDYATNAPRQLHAMNFVWFRLFLHDLDGAYDLITREGLRSDLVLWIPYVLVIAAAAVVGLIRDFSRSMWPISISTFTRTKPIRTNDLAWSHLLVMTRFAFACLIVIFLAVTVPRLLGNPFERELLADAALNGVSLTLPYLYLLEPLFWACILAWLALGCMRPIAIVAMAALLLNLWIILLNENVYPGWRETLMPWFLTDRGRVDQDKINLYLFFLVCTFFVARSAVLCYRSWRLDLFSPRQCLLFIAAHLVLTMGAWWPGPRDLYAVSESLFITTAMVCLFLSPIAALPCQIAQKRVRS